MANKSSDVVVPGHGAIFVSVAESAEPFNPEGVIIGDPKTWPKEWQALGHTSRENLWKFTREGGEPKAIGSFEEDAVESIVEDPEINGFECALLEISQEKMELAYGEGEWNDDLKIFEYDEAQPTTKSVQIVFVQGAKKRAGWYGRRCEIKAGSAPELNTSYFFETPLKGTVMSPGDGKRKQGWLATRPYKKAELNPDAAAA